jgi:hypothetical protein
MFATMHRVVDVNYYYKWQTDMGSVQELMGHGLLDVEEAPVASGIDQNLRQHEHMERKIRTPEREGRGRECRPHLTIDD